MTRDDAPEIPSKARRTRTGRKPASLRQEFQPSRKHIPPDSRKVVIVGAGAVGSTLAYTLMRSGLADDIVLIDVHRARVEGDALDMNHGLFFVPPVRIRAGDYDDCRDAAVVVVTAGARQAPGQSRLALVGENIRIVREILDEVLARTRDAVIVMVTNPVDVLTYVAIRHAGLPDGRVLGSGTVLDSARLRFLLSRRFGVDARNVHAYIAGEHGDSEIALWSLAHIGGLHLNTFCQVSERSLVPGDRDAILQEVRQSAYHVIEAKGATVYGVSLALERILGAILRNEHSVLTVSTLLDGVHGLSDVCLSLPCIVNRQGTSQVLQASLDPDEIEGLRRSADVLRGILRQAGAEDARA
jgi:L-lactate dehydrogenase